MLDGYGNKADEETSISVLDRVLKRHDACLGRPLPVQRPAREWAKFVSFEKLEPGRDF